MASLNHRRRNATAHIAILAFAVLLTIAIPAVAQRGQPADGDALLANSDGTAGVEIKLPKLEVRKKDKPLDEQVRVSLYLPRPLGYDPQIYTVALEHSQWQDLDSRGLVGIGFLHLSESRVEISSSAQAKATLVTVYLSNPLSTRLAEIVRSLFPHTTVRRDLFAAGTALLKNQPEPTDSLPCVTEVGTMADADDLLIYVEMIPRLVERKEPIRVLERLDVQVMLTILDAARKTVAVIDVVGAAEVDGFTFNRFSPWKDTGKEALLQVSDNLVEAIRSSQKLGACLKKLAEPRSLPSGLIVTAKLDDAASLFPNGRLDAGEEARLVVHIENQGPGPAYRVGVQTSSDRPEITVSGDGAIGDLNPGGKKDVTLHVAGGLGLPAGLAKLRVEATEKRGYGSRPVQIELVTSPVLPPKLEIVDIALNDRSGRATGDGDGQPGNGESIEAVVRVRNAGPGDGAGVAVTMASPKAGAEILDPKVVLPQIPAGRVEEARLLFRLPFALVANELPLSFQAVDGRGAQVGSATREQVWKIRTKRPAVELEGFRFYDGTSAGSIGNRDDHASNGERIEVVVTPANRGELTARGVRIAVEADDIKLIPKPILLEIGDLPAQASGVAQHFAFDIPREYGLDRPTGEIHLTLTVSQQDFPPHREPIPLSFLPLRPELALETTAPSLVRGTRDELVLRLRNVGGLRAEDVVVEVSTEAVGIDLLNERGVPVRSRKLVVGELDPQAAAPQASVPINIRRNAVLGSAPLHITVTQKDFSPLIRDAELSVAEEPAAVIVTEPSEERMPARAPVASMAPATISFLDYTPGQHLLAEMISLRFEIQAPVELAEKRLMHNDQLVSLNEIKPSRSSSGGLQRTEFNVSIQLEHGENRFEVVVVTQQGLRSVRSLSLFHDRKVGRLWVVAIGVSKYQDQAIPPLRYADADARAVYEYFRDTFNLQNNQIFLRVNEQATLREIKSLLGTQISAQADDLKDTVILYFAGHGMRDRVTRSFDPYFLPYDARSDDLYSTAFEMDEVTNLLRRLIPERVVVLIDSCFSGAAGGRSPYDPKAKGERALLSDEFLGRMASAGKGRAVLTASGPDEAAQEDSGFGHGVFTYYLLEGLRGAADANHDGDIDVNEAYKYLSEKVSQTTDRRQHPNLKQPNVEGQVLLAPGALRRRP